MMRARSYGWWLLSEDNQREEGNWTNGYVEETHGSAHATEQEISRQLGFVGTSVLEREVG